MTGKIKRRHASNWIPWALSIVLAAMAVPAQAQPVGAEVRALIYTDVEAIPQAGLSAFYAERRYRPLWLDTNGAVDAAAGLLLDLLNSADADGLDRSALGLTEVVEALRQLQTGPSPATSARVEVALSRSFDAYVRAMRQVPQEAMTFADPALRPSAAVGAALREAARAPSLSEYIRDIAWMHPLYASLRRTLAHGGQLDPLAREVALENLVRLRALPARDKGRHVIVDSAEARLWMYEDGKSVDSMRVVVGKPGEQTPMIAGSLNRAILNPYWNVPYDLVPRMVASRVLQRGVGYIRSAGFEVLSDWGDNPSVVDPGSVDWSAAARGEIELRVRQLPRFGNAMGKVKYEFPNEQGIYLHDTPDMHLMTKDGRQFSSGCIRLEDAERFGRWLLQSTLPRGSGPEQTVELPSSVPIYVTYLTAAPGAGGIALSRDPYGRDDARRRSLAASGAPLGAESR